MTGHRTFLRLTGLFLSLALAVASCEKQEVRMECGEFPHRALGVFRRGLPRADLPHYGAGDPC